MSNIDYNNVEGWRSTQLKNIATFGLFDTLHPDGVLKPEDAFKFGNLFHTMVLEPQFLDARYVVSPKFDMRTKAGKIDSLQFEKENDKIIMPADEFIMAKGMTDVVLSRYGSFIENAEKEVIFTSEIPIEVTKGERTEVVDVKVKIMVDIVNRERGIFADLKSTAEALYMHKMKFVMADYHYDLSYAYYHDVLKLCDVNTNHFGLLFSSKKDYRSLFFRPTSRVLENGRAKYGESLLKIAHYEAFGDIEGVFRNIDLPDWAVVE